MCPDFSFKTGRTHLHEGAFCKNTRQNRAKKRFIPCVFFGYGKDSALNFLCLIP